MQRKKRQGFKVRMDEQAFFRYVCIVLIVVSMREAESERGWHD